MLRVISKHLSVPLYIAQKFNLPPKPFTTRTLFSHHSVRNRRNRARFSIDTPEDPRNSLPAYMSTPVPKPREPGNRDPEHRKKMRGMAKDSPDVRISKTLSWILRHGAKSEGLHMRPDGYVKVTDLVRGIRILGLKII